MKKLPRVRSTTTTASDLIADVEINVTLARKQTPDWDLANYRRQSSPQSGSYSSPQFLKNK